MQECPKCQSTEIRKDGIVKQKQRFKCKLCNYRFTVHQIGKPISKRQDAFILYLAGLDYRRIGNLIDVSHVTIYNWLKSVKGGLGQIKRGKQKAIQIPDLVKYLGHKDGKKDIKGLLIIEFTNEATNRMFVIKDNE